MEWNKFEGLSDSRLQPAYPFVEHESEYGWVLVATEYGDIHLASMVWEDHDDEVYYWADVCGEPVHDVTHWMPLPTLPKECKE